MAIIDPAIVKVLVETQLQLVDVAVIPAASIFFIGDPGPDNLDRKVKLVSINSEPLPHIRSNTGGDEPDVASIAVMLHVECSRSRMDDFPGSLVSMQAELVRVLSQVALRHVATNHQVDLRRARLQTDPEIDPQRQAACGSVRIEGTVCRTAGSSMTAFVS